ncbi:MAG: gluconeogenesis factor YvcK family protein [Candidatus Promineifilaceae bacterium]
MSRRYSPRKAWSGWRGWLIPGIGLKRWLVVLGVGAVIAGTGIASLLIVLRQADLVPSSLYSAITLRFLPSWLRVTVPLLVGGLIMLLAIVRIGETLLAPFRRPDEALIETLSHYSSRSRGPHIVAIGGGTGLPGLLRGLRQYTSNITAIITVADDGGSSGRLRRELGVLPPGDFRNNIAALARDEALMTQLLQYRFGGRPNVDGDSGRSELQGHAFGNLLLAALSGITGSFDEALLAAGRVLAMRGRVLPSTLANVVLVAEVAVGTTASQRVVGESAIPKAGGRVKRVMLEPADAAAYPPAVQAILQADLIVIGPGSLYTSILPNLLVADIGRALQQSRASKVYVCNLATQPGETDNYDVADHVSTISAHVSRTGLGRGRWVDMVLANNNLSVPPGTGGGNTIFVQPVEPPGIPMIATDLVDEEQPWRHDSAKLAAAVLEIAFRRKD